MFPAVPMWFVTSSAGLLTAPLFTGHRSGGAPPFFRGGARQAGPVSGGVEGQSPVFVLLSGHGVMTNEDHRTQAGGPDSGTPAAKQAQMCHRQCSFQGTHLPRTGVSTAKPSFVMASISFPERNATEAANKTA
jgi:hypothetical protein